MSENGIQELDDITVTYFPRRGDPIRETLKNGDRVFVLGHITTRTKTFGQEELPEIKRFENIEVDEFVNVSAFEREKKA
jgi:single-stranded DNA-binding protein